MARQEEMASGCAREVEVGHQKEALEQTAKGVGGVSIPGNVQGKTGRGNYHHSLVDKVVQSKVRLNHLTAPF